MSLYHHYVKRTLDIVLSIILLALCSWLMVIVFLIYLIAFNGSVIYFQKRIGIDGKHFLLYKFRTLSTAIYLPLKQRQFGFGSLLRKCSLDELPQLFNVLKGEMSLVGPRPLPIEYLTLFSEAEKKRHKILPGITGWAQVNGRNSITWKQKFEYDLYYVDHISFMLDMKILYKTMFLIFSSKPDVSLSEPKFTGNN